MSRSKSPLIYIPLPTLSKRITNFVILRYAFLFVCLFIYLFFTFLDSRNRLDRKGETARTLEDCLCRRFDGSSSVCVSDNFFPFSIFLVLFREWHDILKEIEESSLRHGIAVTSSRRGSVTGFFLSRSIFGGRDNFVISLPSSTAHFNWIPHEFSVLLASCLFIKLQTAAHVFFINTLGATHFNTLVRFVFP